MEASVEVSVLCATYNQERYLRRCLDSLVSQETSFRYEILVHDDASTDSTVDIIKEYVEKYPEIIHPFYQSENQYSKGVKITKEFQFPRAKGRYIAFCEGDDFWSDNKKLQIQYNALEENLNCVACVAKTSCCNEDGSVHPRTIPDRSVHITGGEISSSEACFLIYNGYAFQTTSFFFRREVLAEAYSKPYSVVLNGDEALLMAAVSLGNFYYIDMPLSTYRVNALGSWNENSRKWDRTKQIEQQMRIQNIRFCFYNDTGRKFREQTIAYLIHRCYIPDKRYLDKVLSQIGIQMREVYSRCDFKHKLIFLTIRHMPVIWQSYRDRKRM